MDVAGAPIKLGISNPKSLKVLAVVVLYFPERNVVQFVNSILEAVDKVLVVDNSEPPTRGLVEAFQADPRVEYLASTRNEGVAYALNKGLRRAMSENFDWLLTLDQDSTFPERHLHDLLEVAKGSGLEVGMVVPAVNPDKEAVDRIEIVRFGITSGALLRVEAGSRTGMFEEKLFIDSVDNEYCLRLRKTGYRIVRANHCTLQHEMGNLVRTSFLGIQVKFVSRPSWRSYYFTRNLLHTMFKYAFFDPSFFWFGVTELSKQGARSIFLEKNKLSHLSAMFLGVVDFVRRRYENL